MSALCVPGATNSQGDVSIRYMTVDHAQPELPHDLRMPGAIGGYTSVTKPRIIAGNVISAAGGFFFASRSDLDFALLPLTLVGTATVVVSGCVLNSCVDRKMMRTSNRVLAQRLMTPKAAVFYASLLDVTGIAIL